MENDTIPTKQVDNTRGGDEKSVRNIEARRINHHIPKTDFISLSSDNGINFYQLFENSINAVLLTVPNGDILAANQSACKLFGCTEDEIRRFGRNGLVDLTDPRLSKAIEERARTGKFQGELTFVRKDGTKFTGEIVSSLFKDKDGNDKTSMTIIDITERKNSEDVLRRSEEKFRSVVENAREGIMVIQDGERVYCNPRWLEIIGYSTEEYTTIPFLSRIHPEDSEFVAQNYKKFKNHETIISDIEFRLFTKSNETKFLSSRASHIQWENKPAEMVMFEDITDRKRAEQERLAYLRFLESMDKINHVIQRTNDLEQMMGDVLDIVLSLLNCERVYLMYPCDPEADTWTVPMERSKPGFEGSVYTKRLEVLMEPGVAEMLRIMIDCKDPVTFGLGNAHPLDEQTIKRHGFQSMLTTVLYPKAGKAWQLGIHQFSYPRIWTDEEIRLFQGISRRLEDALTSLLMYRDLKERENKYRELADSITDVFFAMDHDLKYTYWNKATENLTGIRAEDAIGKSIMELFPDVLWAKRAEKVYRDVLLTQQPQTYINEPDFRGRSFIFEISVYPSMSGLAVFIKDITERKQAEKALQESEIRYRELFEHMPSGVAVYDVIDGGKDFIFKEYNSAAEQFEKRSRKDIIGKSIFDAFPGVEEFGLIDAFRKTIKSGRPVHHPTTFYKDDRLSAWYDNYIYLLPSGELVAVFDDVTNKKKAEEALRENEEKLNIILDTVPAMIWAKDLNGKYLWANKCHAESVGFQKEEMAGKTDYDIFTKEQADKFRKDDNEVEKTSKPKIAILEPYKRPDGTEGWVRTNKLPFFNKSKDVVGIIGLAAEVTEQKRIEDALKKNEEKLRLMTETIEDVFWISTPGVKEMIYVSPPYEKIWGRSCQSLYDNPKSFLETVFPEDREILYNTLKKYHALGKPYQCEYRIQPSNDQIRWIYERGFPVHDSIGNLRYMTGVCTDVTSRKLAQEALTADERLLYEVGRIARIGGWEMDLITRKAKWTKGSYDIVEIGYGEPVPGTDEHLDFYLPEYRPVVEKAMKDLIEKDISLDFEAKAKTAKGNVRWFRAIGRTIRKDGVCIKIFGTLQDTTERKVIEESIIEYQEQLKSLASQLTLTEEKERSRIAMELHDQIGQHLALSIMKLQSLGQKTDSNDAHKILAEVCEWLNHTIEQIRSLTFDLSSSMLYGLSFEHAVAAWLEDVVQKKYNIKTEFQCDSLPKSLEDDVRVLLFRNVRELLFNVIKHAHAQKVKVSITEFESKIKIVVEDDGIGFDPLEVTTTAVRKARFGLFSIRERLEHFGGCLDIDSSPNHGCRITLIAPLMKAK